MSDCMLIVIFLGKIYKSIASNKLYDLFTHKVCTQAKNEQFLKLRRVLSVRGFKQWPGQDNKYKHRITQIHLKNCTSDWTQQPDHHWVLFTSLYRCLCVCSEIPQLLFQVTLMMMMMMMMAHSKHTCLTQMWTLRSSIKLWWLQMMSSLYNYQEQSAASFLCHLYIFLPKLSAIIVFPWQRLR